MKPQLSIFDKLVDDDGPVLLGFREAFEDAMESLGWCDEEGNQLRVNAADVEAVAAELSGLVRDLLVGEFSKERD